MASAQPVPGGTCGDCATSANARSESGAHGSTGSWTVTVAREEDSFDVPYSFLTFRTFSYDRRLET